MVDQTKEQSNKPCCKDGEKQQEKKLVKATDLPIHGNPFPPKDCVQDETSGLIETNVRAARTMLEPYVSPLSAALEKTTDFVSIGIAHSIITMQRLAENENSVVNAAIISGSGLLGFALARRGGLFRKILYTSALFGAATVACYPKQSEEKAKLLWYIAENKLPEAAKQRFEKFSGPKTE